MLKPTQKAFETFRQKVNERLQEVRDAFESMHESALVADRNALINASKTFKSAAESLLEILPSESWPSWLSRLLNNSNRVISAPNENKFLKILVGLINQNASVAKDFDWTYDPESMDTPDIASIIEEEVSDKGINERFDRVIGILQEIVKSSDLDHDRAYSDLLTVLSMLKKAKGSGYAEKIFTWNFVKRFLPNLLLEAAKATPALGPCVKAFEKTVEEVDLSFREMRESVTDRFYLELQGSFENRIENISPQMLLTDQSSRP